MLLGTANEAICQEEEILVWKYIVIAVGAYLFGSISSGVLVSRWLFHEDVRTHGSGSAGSTNMLRNYSAGAAALTFLFDFLKAVIPTYLGLLWMGRLGGEIAAAAALVGHIFPVFFQFHGGKGMVTAAGGILVLYPALLPCLLLPWIVLVLTTRIVSIGSLTAAALYPVGAALWAYFHGLPVLEPLLFSLGSAILIIFMHRSNIKRLINGTENRFGGKKKEAPEEPPKTEE